MNELMYALCVLLGQEDVQWAKFEVDEVEWTDPKYYHQN